MRDPRPKNRLSQTCHHVVKSTWFQWLSISVILINAVSLGVSTYPELVSTGGFFLAWIDTGALVFFTGEVIIGLIAFGRKPWHYFRHGWNIFDFIVVVAAYMPGLRENATLLRLLRLARILKLFQAFPNLRVIVVGAAKSIPRSVGLIAMTTVIIYLWGMLGCIMFGADDPERFGTIDRSALHLFQLMLLDDVGNTIRSGIEISPLTVPYYLIFIFVGAFILFNILIGVVLASMEEARRSGEEPPESDSGPGAEPTAPRPTSPTNAPASSPELRLLLERTAQLQDTVDSLRDELRQSTKASPDEKPELIPTSSTKT